MKETLTKGLSEISNIERRALAAKNTARIMERSGLYAEASRLYHEAAKQYQQASMKEQAHQCRLSWFLSEVKCA